MREAIISGWRSATGRISCGPSSAVATDDDWIVQLKCYTRLIDHLAPARRDEVPSGKTGFDRTRDVDWDLLAEWRERN